MEVGTQHIAKLEPFLLMSKAAKGAAAAKLIQDATAAPGVFVFGELLEQPNVQEVRTRAHMDCMRLAGQKGSNEMYVVVRERATFSLLLPTATLFL